MFLTYIYYLPQKLKKICGLMPNGINAHLNFMWKNILKKLKYIFSLDSHNHN